MHIPGNRVRETGTFFGIAFLMPVRSLQFPGNPLQLRERIGLNQRRLIHDVKLPVRFGPSYARMLP